MKRDKFTFYGSWWDAAGCLSGELRGEVLTAIIEYGLYGETNSARGGTTKAILELVKPQIDRERILYENGCQGGRPKNQGETNLKPSGNQSETKQEPWQNQGETNLKPDETKAEPCPSRARDNSLYISCINNITQEEKESKEIEGAGGKRKQTPARRFVKPTVEEVEAYCLERGNSVDARTFWDFYESKGWMIGRNPMKDWRAAVRTWERDRGGGRGGGGSGGKSVLAPVAVAYEENERTMRELMEKARAEIGEDEFKQLTQT